MPAAPTAVATVAVFAVATIFYIGYDMSHLMLAGENLDVPSFSFDGVLDEHTPFFWKVVCKDNEYDVEGPIWSFVTGP